MNERVKKLWLDKLAVSKQTTNCLHDPYNDSYCCLGVLTQCYIDEMNLSWNDLYLCGTYSGHDKNVYGWECNLDPVVSDWAGLSSPDPEVDRGVDNKGYAYCSLSVLNDNEVPFTEISKYIEKL